MNDAKIERIYVELRALNKKLNAIMSFLGITELENDGAWVTQEKFIELTGMNTRQLEYFRANNPTMVKFKDFGTSPKSGKPVRRGFKYNWLAYQEQFTNPILK